MGSSATYHHHLFVVFYATMMMALLPTCDGSVNLFLSRDETRRLLGLQAELYYIREGKVNDYALKFVVPVPSEISELHFTWQSLTATPILYSIGLSVNDLKALGTPLINISRAGFLSRKEQVFRITLPCTGKVAAEVDVNLYINITTSKDEVTALTLKRKKICFLETNTVASDVEDDDLATGGQGSDGIASSEEEEEDALLFNSSAMVSSWTPLYTALGCASGFIFLLGALVTLCFVRSRKRNSSPVNYAGVSSHLSVNKVGQSFLNIDSQSNSSSHMYNGSNLYNGPNGHDGTNNRTNLGPNLYDSPLRLNIPNMYEAQSRHTVGSQMSDGSHLYDGANIYASLHIDNGSNYSGSEQSLPSSSFVGVHHLRDPGRVDTLKRPIGEVRNVLCIV
ncbi:Tyrosine-protein kinase RYK [Halotydeus destructor]|nr:Tyrosine-protein kinase RYK [Halotydeus destructor]